MASTPGFLVFDIETIPDGDFISRAKYRGFDYCSDTAIRRAEEDALAESNGKSDFIPLTYHIPIVCGLLWLDSKFVVKDHRVLRGEPKEIAHGFWKCVDDASCDTLVSFNGRGFDLPLMELMAFRFGVPITAFYFDRYGPRNRFSNSHIDLMDWFGNYGTHRMVGGLGALARMLERNSKIGNDGKEMDGSKILQLYRDNHHSEIADYCIRDVMDTYAVFLRTRVMLGLINLDQEAKILRMATEQITHLAGVRYGVWPDYNPAPGEADS